MDVSSGIGGVALLLEVTHDKSDNSTHGCGGMEELRMAKNEVFGICQFVDLFQL